MPELRLFKETLQESAGFASNADRGVKVNMAESTAMQDLIYNGMIEGRVVPRHVREFAIREALTTSDFPFLFGDVLDRQMLATYQAAPAVWKQFTKMSTVKDFKDAYRFRMDGGDEHLEIVAEKGEYLASDRTETKYTISVDKFGRQFDISWEAMINDDLNALKDTPQRFAKASIRTEHRVVTGLYYHNVVLATGARGNLTAALLTIANLEAGVEWFGGRTDVGGEAIPTRPKFLVVVPGLEMTARQILTSASKVWSDNAGGPVAYPTNNVIAQMGLQLIVDPYAAILNTEAGEAGTAATGWWLFTDPNELAVLEAAHLSGHERPEICMKASDKVSIGGGALGPMSGDFATDNVFYRVRLPFGGTTLDWRGFYFGGHT